jgi:predicted dehydrogenase
MNELRIAVAGAGLIGLRHIEEVQNNAGTRLSAIVDFTPQAAEAARVHRVPLYGSLGELFARDRPDGVVLATPNQLHVEQGLECIAAGVPALIEKPLAHTLADGRRLCEAVERASATVLVGHHRLHNPIIRKAVDVVRSGILGPLVAVMGSAVFYKQDVGYFDGPYAWRSQPGGGPILINMVHEVASLRAMVGEIAAVQAFASNRTRQFAVEDTVAINLRFANGALGTFLLSDTAACAKSWEQTSGENKAYPKHDDEDAYVVMGTNGSLGVPTMRVRYYEQTDRSWFKPFATRIEAVEDEDPLALQIEHFAAVIRGEAKPLVTCRDGLSNLTVVDAIAEAARTGRPVEIGSDRAPRRMEPDPFIQQTRTTT